jgi:uncharacterized protein YjdB
VSAASVAVASVSLNRSTLSLIVGGPTLQLTATIAPSNATDQGLTWSSSDANIVRVYAGLLTAVAPGTATITVTTVDGAHTATCDVTVLPLAAP